MQRFFTWGDQIDLSSRLKPNPFPFSSPSNKHQINNKQGLVRSLDPRGRLLWGPLGADQLTSDLKSLAHPREAG